MRDEPDPVKWLFLGRLHGNFERRIADDLRHPARADALGASKDRFVGAVFGRDMYALQVGLELAARDASDFGTDPAEVFFLTTGGYGIAHLGAFATYFTLSGHDFGPSLLLLGYFAKPPAASGPGAVSPTV